MIKKHSLNADLCPLLDILNITKQTEMVKQMFRSFLDPDGLWDHSQNLIISSLSLCRHFLNVLSESVHCFLSYVDHKLTNISLSEAKLKTSGLKTGYICEQKQNSKLNHINAYIYPCFKVVLLNILTL